MAFLDALTRALAEGLQGFQQFQFQIRPFLDQQALAQQELQQAQEERRLARLTREHQSMLALAGGDPRQAYRMFGQRFLDVTRDLTGVQIPTRTVPVTRTVTERVQTGFRVMPKTQPTAYERYRAQERGQPFVPKVYPIYEQRTREEPTGETRTELDLPETILDREITLPGGQRARLRDLQQVLPPSAIADLLGIEDPIQRARLNLQMAQHSLNEARFDWERYKYQNPSAYQREMLRLRELEIGLRDAQAKANLALQQGRLDEYARHNQAIEDIQREANEIRRRAVAVSERREARLGQAKIIDPATARQIENEVRDAKAALAALRAQRAAIMAGAYVNFRGTVVDETNVDAVIAGLEAEVREREAALAEYRSRQQASQQQGQQPSQGQPRTDAQDQQILATLNRAYPPAQHRGKVIRHKGTGRVYRSDGRQWIRVQ